VERQLLVPITYLGRKIEPGLRLDLLVEGKVIVECKAVETMNPVYLSQVKPYLKLANKRLGILVNFNVPLIKDGLKRVIL
jgi:GxxExxY protein